MEGRPEFSYKEEDTPEQAKAREELRNNGWRWPVENKLIKEKKRFAIDHSLLIAAMSIGEVACTYATMILHDDGIPITAEKIAILVKSSNVSVESYWPSLFAKLAEKRNIDNLILNVGSGGSAAPVAAAPIGGAAAVTAPAAEEKKEELKEESDDDMCLSLFD
ncbi:hypothetical protein SAY86_021726 [Trapa natans]|uniref:60S acidic ribosomal protein p1 n=1 Tax=Trapa natans TaxID=22666 RepID=A0AAN7MA86_TRANT|nr:hypothetical protein SAY86_021726 [Trapa natans]